MDADRRALFTAWAEGRVCPDCLRLHLEGYCNPRFWPPLADPRELAREVLAELDELRKKYRRLRERGPQPGDKWAT